MSKTWKIVIWVLVVLAVLAFIAFITIKSVFDKIQFSPRLTNLDLKGLTLNDLIGIAFSDTQKEVSLGLAIDINNASRFSIPFSIYKIALTYDGTIIAESSDALSEQNFVLPANGKVSIIDTVKILLNDSAGNMIIEKLKGGKPEIKYTISFSVFGIPIPYNGGSFKW